MKILYTDLNQIITLEKAFHKNGRHLIPEDLSTIPNGAIVFDEKILWVGATSDIPKEYQNLSPISLKNKILLPEIVDSHTHILFAGDRSGEYWGRLNGDTYEMIAQKGGGILYTQQETIKHNAEKLFDLASERIEKIASRGIGTIEIKSGYGLTLEKEKELTEIISLLKLKYSPTIQIINTYMAAHAIPKNSSAEEYIHEVVIPVMKELFNQIDIVDVFCEEGYFNHEHTKLLFQTAQKLNLPVKLHADEFTSNGGAELAVEYKALSADHLLQISEQGIKALASSTTIATLLPGTAFFLGKNLAPARALLDAGARVAIASDYNPGSCHWDNLIQIAKMSAPSLKMNSAELMCAITLNAAASLGLMNQGALIPGMAARMSILDYSSLENFMYNW